MSKAIENKINYLGDNGFKRDLKQILRNFDCRLDKFEGYMDKERGYSAYEIWLQEGNTGTEQDFLNSLKGKDGKSVLQLFQEIPGNEDATIDDLLAYLKGPKGDDGEKGDKGEPGDPGKNGDKGDKGEPGDTGKSAYQIWLDEGNTGTEEDFLNSLKGGKGDKGDTGAPGKDGLPGEKGKQGDKGEQGIQGLQGEQGLKGEQGLQGLKGDKGPQGDVGPAGPEGPQGPKGEQGDVTLNLEDIAGNGLIVKEDKIEIDSFYYNEIASEEQGSSIIYKDQNNSSISVNNTIQNIEGESTVSNSFISTGGVNENISSTSTINGKGASLSKTLDYSGLKTNVDINSNDVRNNTSLTISENSIDLKTNKVFSIQADEGVKVNDKPIVTSVNDIPADVNGNVVIEAGGITEDSIGDGLTIQDDKLTLGGVYLDSPVLAQVGIEPFFFKGHIPFQDVRVKQGGVDTSLAMNVSLGDNMTVAQFSGEELEFPLATVNVVKSIEQSQSSITLAAYETVSEASAVTVNLDGIDLSSNKPITINHIYNMVKKVNEQRADKDGNIVLPFKTINGNSIQGTGDITIEAETQELKTLNGETLIGKGNIVIEKGITNIKTVNGQTLVGEGNLEIEKGISDIKTVNGQSLIGTGNIEIDLSLPNEIKKTETDTVTDPLKRPIEKQYLLSYDKIIASTKGYDSRYRKDFINKGVTLTPEEGIKVSNLETGKIESTVELSKKGLDIKHLTFTEQGAIGEYFELKLNNTEGLKTSSGEGANAKSLSVDYNNVAIRNGLNTFDASLSNKNITLGVDGKLLELTTTSIKLHDKITGEPVTITVENGVLKIV